MKIEDFLIGTDELAEFNYVLVADNEETVSELREMGCSDDEISSMRSEEDNFLEVYRVLCGKGYTFSIERGFYKE